MWRVSWIKKCASALYARQEEGVKILLTRQIPYSIHSVHGMLHGIMAELTPRIGSEKNESMGKNQISEQ